MSTEVIINVKMNKILDDALLGMSVEPENDSRESIRGSYMWKGGGV